MGDAPGPARFDRVESGSGLPKFLAELGNDTIPIRLRCNGDGEFVLRFGELAGNVAERPFRLGRSRPGDAQRGRWFLFGLAHGVRA